MVWKNCIFIIIGLNQKLWLFGQFWRELCCHELCKCNLELKNLNFHIGDCLISINFIILDVFVWSALFEAIVCLN